MSSSLADVLVKLDLDSAQYRQNMQKATQETRDFAKNISSMASAITGAFAFDAVVSRAANTMRDAFQWVKDSARQAQDLVKFSQQVGVTVEQMSRLDYAAKKVGLSGEEVGAALQKLSKNMEAAAIGGEGAGKAFELLGINVRDATTGNLRSSVAVMEEVAARFARMKDGADKTALAMMLFGRAGADMIPLLNKGATGLHEMYEKADKLGRTISTETAQAAAQFGKELAKLHASTQALGMAIAAELLPDVQLLTKEMAIGTSQTKDWAKTIVDVARGSLPLLLPGLGDFAEGLYRVARARQAMIDAENKAHQGTILDPEKFEVKPPKVVDQKSLDDQAKAIERVKAEVASLNEKTLTAGLDSGKALEMSIYFGKWSEALRATGSAAEVLRPKLLAAAQAAAAAEDQARVAKEGAEAYERLAKGAEQMEVELTKLQGATELERTYQSLQNGELSREIALADAAGKATGELTARYLVAAQALDEQRAAQERAAEAQRQLDQAVSEAKGILQSHAGPLERYNQQLEKINDAFSHGALTVDQYTKALAYAKQDFEKAGGVMNDFARGTSHALEGAFAGFFQDVNLGLEGLVANFGKAMMQMVAQAYAAKLAQAIFSPSGGGLTSGINAVGNWLGIGGAGGGAAAVTGAGGELGSAIPVGGTLGLEHFASGGDIRAGQLAIVGEHGPEPFIPNVSGRIVSHEEARRALGSSAAAGPQTVLLQVHPDALHMTLSDWLQGELARQASQRGRGS